MHINKHFLFALGLALMLTACGDDNDTPAPMPDDGGGTAATVNYNRGGYFLATQTADGREWVMQVDSLGGTLAQAQNQMELPTNHYTWIFKDQTAIGMVYMQQFAGVGYALRYRSESQPFSQIGAFTVDTRFNTYGIFQNQLITIAAGQLYTDDNGNSRNDGAVFAVWNIEDDGVKLQRTHRLSTEDITGNGQQITFSGVVDQGDGTFLTAMVQSDFHQTGTGNGSTVGNVAYPDSVWVARMDGDLNIQNIYRDDRISYAAGHYRAQVLRTLHTTTDGTTYVFSNSFNENSTRPAGALRINRGATEFDQDYYMNLQEPAGGYKFRRVWYMTDHLFLLEIYNEFQVNTMTAGHQFALVDMRAQQFRWIEGLPTKNQIVSGAETGGVPMYHEGKIWLPITQFGQHAMLYTIDPQTAQATPAVTIQGAYEVRTVGYIGR